MVKYLKEDKLGRYKILPFLEAMNINFQAFLVQ